MTFQACVLIMPVLPTHIAGALQVPAWQPLVTSCKAQTSTSYPSIPLSRVLSESPTTFGPTSEEACHTPGWAAEALAVGLGSA